MGQLVTKARKLRFEYQAKAGRKITVQEIADAIGIKRERLTEIELGQWQLISSQVLVSFCDFYSRALEKPINVQDIIEYKSNKRAPVLAAVGS